LNLMTVLRSAKATLQDLAATAARIDQLLAVAEQAEEHGDPVLPVRDQAQALLTLDRVGGRLERLADRLDRTLGEPADASIGTPAAR
jgi:hypothetical protein